MQKTKNLELPIYDNPELDVFDLEDWNLANQNIDIAYEEMASFKQDLAKIDANSEIIEARKGKETLGDKIDEIDSSLEYIEKKKVNNEPLYFYSPFKNNVQGDCFILSYNNKTILIDTGHNSSVTTIINFLNSKNITKIDYMIITHYHTDHCTALSQIVNNFDFSTCKFLLPPTVDWSRFLGDTTSLKNNEQSVLNVITLNGFNYQYLTNKFILTIDNIKLKFLNCNTVNYEYYYNITGDSNEKTENNQTNYNNFSVALIVEHENNKLFFPSDIDIKAQELIVNELENVDFMCFPHHCCNELSNDDFHKVLSPNVCLASGVGYRRYSSTDLIRMFDIATCYNNAIDFELLSVGNTIHVIQGRKILPYSDLGWNSDSIPTGSDLNDYIYPGEYYSSASSISSTLLNCPVTTSGFRLKVRDIISDVSIKQEIISNDANVVIYERYINLVSKTFGEWVELTRTTFNNRMVTSTSDTLVQCINRISDYNFKVFNISTGTSLYEQLSIKISDSHGLYLKVEKLNGNYAILTLTGKSVEKMFIGHFVSGSVTWKEVQFI